MTIQNKQSLNIDSCTYLKLTPQQHDLLLKIVETLSARQLKDQLMSDDKNAELNTTELQLLLYDMWFQLNSK